MAQLFVVGRLHTIEKMNNKDDELERRFAIIAKAHKALINAHQNLTDSHLELLESYEALQAEKKKLKNAKPPKSPRIPK